MIKIVQGETRTFQSSIKENDGTAFDLTGATEIRIWLKKKDGSYTKFSKTSGEITILGDPINGEITCDINAIQSVSLAVSEADSFQGDVTTPSYPLRRIIWDKLLMVIQQEGA